VPMVDLKAVTSQLAAVRRRDPGDQHGAQAPVGDPGRPARVASRRRCSRS
jgi:hypothetical protein